MSKVDLKVDWATHEAAKYACLNWHYSRSIPKSKLVKIGVWESDKFIGVVIFGVGGNRFLSSPYGIEQTEACELVRVALTSHESNVSQILSRCFKMIKKQFPTMRLVISFADPVEGHHGGIYQAGNWIYSGTSKESKEVFFKGKWVKRVDSTRGHFGPKRKTPGKYRYLMPLDKKMRKQILPLAQPYPKRSKQAMDATSVTAMGQHQSDRSTEASHA